MAKGSTTLVSQHGRSPIKTNLEYEHEYYRSSTMGLRSCYTIPWNIQEEYIDEETEALSNKGTKGLNELYKNNQKFKDEIINFVEDEAELDREKILCKRFKYNALNKLGMETRAKFAFSKDYTEDLIEIKGRHFIHHID